MYHLESGKPGRCYHRGRAVYGGWLVNPRCEVVEIVERVSRPLFAGLIIDTLSGLNTDRP